MDNNNMPFGSIGGGKPDQNMYQQMPGQQMPGQQAYTQPVYVQPAPSKPGKGLEISIGKNLMGIFASILIFIGIILLATAVAQYISDEGKMICISGFSVLLFAAGRIGMHFKRNPFFISLAGCGIGAVFISIFLAYGYFDLINIAVLFVCIGVWSVAVAFLGGKDGTVFRVIGQLGVLASLIFGTFQMSSSDVLGSGSEIVIETVFVLFFVAISLFYLFLDYRSSSKSLVYVSLVIDAVGLPFIYATAGQLSELG